MEMHSVINIIKANNIRKQAGYELCDLPPPKALTTHVFISVSLQGGRLGVHLRAGSCGRNIIWRQVEALSPSVLHCNIYMRLQ